MAGSIVPGKLCPDCGAEVIERVNKASGSPFWGCATWPACAWTMPIPADEHMRRAGAATLPGFEGVS